LHRIGEVSGVAIDAGCFEGAVEQMSCGADERVAGAVLLIAGLLSDDHQRCRAWSFAEHRLRGRLPEMTASTLRRGLSQRSDRMARWQIFGGAHFAGRGAIGAPVRTAIWRGQS